MNLKTYAIERGGTGKRECPVLRTLADAAGCSAGTMYMIAIGNRAAGGLLAGAIEAATGGAVDRVDLRPDLFSRVA